MRLYSIAIPERMNDGKPYPVEHEMWEEACLRTAGGFTLRPSGNGVWRDPETKKIYRDVMREYQIACNPSAFRELRYQAARIFADQEAFFWVVLGEATISTRRTCLNPIFDATEASNG